MLNGVCAGRMGSLGSESCRHAGVKRRNHQALDFSGAAEVTPDKQGRILIPQNLRQFAGLEKDVVVIGANNKAEIWEKSRWEALNDAMNREELLSVMEELGF